MASSLRKKALLSLGSVLVVLGALELGLRTFAPVFFGAEMPMGRWPLLHQRSGVPGLTYELRPDVSGEVDGVRVRTNSLGMRDEELLPAGTPGLRRVAVLGDSIAFGWGLEQGRSFCDELERLLRAAPFDLAACDVLNFGVAGYSTEDEVDQFVHRAAELAPDLVIVAYCLNDPEDGQVQRLGRFFAGDPLWQRSHLARWIARRLHRARVRAYGGGNYYRYLHAPDGPEWPSVVRAFDRLRTETERAGIPVVVAIFPWVVGESWEGYLYADVHAQVAALAEAHGFRVLDLLPAFAAHAPREVEFSAQDPHPTELGHALAARELAPVAASLLEAAPAAGAPPPASGGTR